MTSAAAKIVTAVKGKLRTTVGKRFSRFVLVAIASLASSLLTLSLLLGVFHVTAGLSGIIGAIVGAAVSYVLSRWAWERKGRPHLLKETLPFWLVSLGAWTVLGLTSHYASVWALSMGHTHWERVLIVDGAYLVANCVTFISRFLIFHYFLFADRGSKLADSVVSAVEASGTPVPPAEPVPAAGAAAGPEPLAASGSGARVGGSPAWAGSAAERSPGRRPSADSSALPEPGTRR
ncbi:MAG TPA: GtrA family protein [Streptosporangiaceae bacterium]|nr:GtrA family protein [Streptosporangiaceae bacterium]